MRKTLKWLGATLVASTLVLGLTSAASAAQTVDTSTSRVNAAGHAIPPLHVPIKLPSAQRVAPATITPPTNQSIYGPSSLRNGCVAPGTFVSGAQAASWLGTSVAGDSAWPDPSANGGRVWAANGGWTGGHGTWFMASPSADDMRRVYVTFTNGC